MADRPTAEATRADAQWIGFVGAVTGCVTWVANRWVFSGSVPPEFLGVIQFGVPLGLTALAAEVRWRTARRRKECETPAE
ncbi:hypothetical protein ABTY59_37435 [Streptomyces sp. NPDC096079]|uniref:hypothetical protein n=1 Tax=Streptomyces sp. NPDC096079 TaxID=3155820 RepID=UPI00331EBE78